MHQDPMFVYKEPSYMAKLGKGEEKDYITGDRMATFMLYLSDVSPKIEKSISTMLFVTCLNYISGEKGRLHSVSPPRHRSPAGQGLGRVLVQHQEERKV